MDDLVEWLKRQLDEDERVAKQAAEAHPAPWRIDATTESVVDADGDNLGTGYDGMWEEVFGDHAEHIARHDPARVLREVEAKRRIIDRHTMKVGEHVTRGICAECGGSDWKPSGADRLDPYPWVMPWPCPTLRLLALPYADRPGYQESWRP